jgi:hypothetical protein
MESNEIKFSFDPCGIKTQNKIIPLEEKGKKFTGLNGDEKLILKVQVDGCLKIKGTKCDWLLIDIEGNVAHFIELKGCDLKHAFDQLEHTITEISNPGRKYISKKFEKKKAYLVISHSPLSSAKLDNKKKEFMKKFKTPLIVKKNEIKEKL